MYTRFSKIALIWAIALFALLAAFSNLIDYDSNYKLISQVLKMDTTHSDNNAMWRAIDSPFVHHLVYGFIIFSETAIAKLCWMGGFNLFKAASDPDSFKGASKNPG